MCWFLKLQIHLTKHPIKPCPSLPSSLDAHNDNEFSNRHFAKRHQTISITQPRFGCMDLNEDRQDCCEMMKGPFSTMGDLCLGKVRMLPELRKQQKHYLISLLPPSVLKFPIQYSFRPFVCVSNTNTYCLPLLGVVKLSDPILQSALTYQSICIAPTQKVEKKFNIKIHKITYTY